MSYKFGKLYFSLSLNSVTPQREDEHPGSHLVFSDTSIVQDGWGSSGCLVTAWQESRLCLVGVGGATVSMWYWALSYSREVLI